MANDKFRQKPVSYSKHFNNRQSAEWWEKTSKKVPGDTKGSKKETKR